MTALLTDNANAWLLPVGAALIALGLTAIGAALWRLRLRPEPLDRTDGVERRVELTVADTTETAPRTRGAVEFDETLSLALDRRIAELEQQFDDLARRLESSRRVGRPTVGLRFARGGKPEETSETRALAALVARGH